MKEKLLAVLGVLCAVVIWGISFVNIKVAIIVFKPMTLGLIRFTLAVLIFTVVIKALKIPIKFYKEDSLDFFLAGGIGITFYYFFETVGIGLTSASEASLIIASIPIFSLIAESIVFKKKIRLLQVFSIVLSIIGVAIVIGIDFNEPFEASAMKGYLMMFGAVLTWVVYSMTTKKLYVKYSKVNILYFQMIFGALSFLPFALFEKNNWGNMTNEVIINVGVLTVFASVIAYYAYNYGLEKLSVAESSLYLNLIPVVTVIFSYFYIGEAITLNKILGGVLIIGAVTLSNFKKKEVVEIELHHKDIV